MSSAKSNEPSGLDALERLQELTVLRDMGTLSAAEFEAQKALVLSRAGSDWRPAPTVEADGP